MRDAIKKAVENTRLVPLTVKQFEAHLRAKKRYDRRLEWARYYLKNAKTPLARMYWLGRIDGITGRI